ncbi:hypothetical protein MBO12_01315 [Candidatus Saccharibacteria bacterium]|nr:hypothetical protein [Candidatus Saccharibacteria bacterium]
MSHILKAAAELFEAIEKDARALVFPVSEMDKNDFTRALMPISTEMSVIAGFAQRYTERCRAYLESGNIAAGEEYAYLQSGEIGKRISEAYERHILSGSRYLPYDVKQRLAAMHRTVSS